MGRGCGDPARRANTEGRSVGSGAGDTTDASRRVVAADACRPASPASGERTASAGAEAEGTRGAAARAIAGAGAGVGAGAGCGAVAAPHIGAGLSPTLCAAGRVQPAGAGSLATGAAGFCGAGAAKPSGRRSTAGTSPTRAPRMADTNGQRSLERCCSCLRASSW
ncbi:hypothetical protein DBR12_01700 [Acidovorax sp. HMWF029]|nr:hypothetical protein DBR12_01700 [Acidovorax sp. HMWF029]